MKNNRIYLSSPHMSDEGYERMYVKEAFDTNWIAPLGENVNKFEKELADRVGIGHAAALNSGTSAIHMALKAAGIGENDIVFCQDLTFSASANPIIYQGANPVFIDSDEKTWNMDPKQLEKAIKKYPEAKAVIVVHLYGMIADMDPILNLCQEHDLVLIEDAAESLGSLYKGKESGTLGDYGIYSFNGNKIITTSGGGMLVSNKKEKIEKVRFWSTQSRDKAIHYQHSELGYNYRMSNIVAGIGRGQLRVLNDRIAKKRYIYNYYKEAFSNIKQIEMMPYNDFNEPNFWLTAITINSKEISPINIIEELEKNNIESRAVWKPMHMQPYFEEYDFIGEGISKKIFEKGLCLPSDTKMTDEDLLRVSNIVKSIFVGE